MKADSTSMVNSSPPKVGLLHNIISPERLPLFEAINKKVELEVLFCNVDSQARKSNTTLLNEYNFNYKILTTTSLNTGDKNPLMLSWDLIYHVFKQNYDCLIACENPPIAGNILQLIFLAKLTNIPLISWMGFIDNPDYKLSWEKNILKKILVNSYRKLLIKSTDKFLAYGQKTKEKLLKSGVKAKNIFSGTQIIESPQTDELPSRKELKKELPIENNIILFVGYFIERKNLNLLIETFKEINPKNWSLLLVGDGPQRNNLKKQAQDNKKIKFTGFKTGLEKLKYYKIADIFVLPTKHDPWGLVVNEAMQFNLPIITTNKAGCAKELVKGNGIVVENNNQNELGNALNKLIKNKPLRKEMGAKSGEIIQNYTIQKGANIFKRAIHHALQG